MRGSLRKSLDVIMVCVSALGILLSIFILIQLWRYRQPVADKLQSTLDQTTNILQTTDEGLGVIDQVIKNVYTSTIYLDLATTAFSQTVQSTNQFMDSASTFVGEDLIATITNTQTALDSSQASALVIDNILSSISKIPFIGITYNPAQPLNIALGKVSTSLDPIQGSLRNFKTNLETTQANMRMFNDQISILEKNILTINQNLAQAQKTIVNYRSQVNSLKSWVESAKTTLPSWITIIAWILTIIIFWLIVIQISILLQGITHLTSAPKIQASPGEQQ
jgi:ABC-type transporter Mla subunit MlaD